ncbi:MAG: HAD family hydrolase [Chloroflexota bacterium]
MRAVPYTWDVPVCPYDAVIFDFDGVLINSEPIFLAATNAVFAREGRVLSAEAASIYNGLRLREMLMELIPLLDLTHDVDFYIRESRIEEARLFSAPMEPPPGAAALLRQLDELAVPRAVGSSSDHAWVDRMLTHLGIRQHLPIIVGGDQVPAAKPAPDILLRCAELLDVQPARCLVIEDSIYGVLAAHRAGMTTLGFPMYSNANLKFSGCCAIAWSFQEVADHLGISISPPS